MVAVVVRVVMTVVMIMIKVVMLMIVVVCKCTLETFVIDTISRSIGGACKCVTHVSADMRGRERRLLGRFGGGSGWGRGGGGCSARWRRATVVYMVYMYVCIRHFLSRLASIVSNSTHLSQKRK